LADFFTSSHRFSATVIAPRKSLAAILEDNMTSYLELADIYVSRVDTPSDIVATYQKASLVKRDIHFILLSAEGEAGSKQSFYSRSRLSAPIFIAVPSFEIEGKLQGVDKIDLQKILSSGPQKFLPLVDGNVRNSLFPKVSFHGPRVLINKAKIQILCFNDKE
jgi:hypothetical protein